MQLVLNDFQEETNERTLSTRTLLFLEEGSANRTISGCLNLPDTVSVVAGGVTSVCPPVFVVVALVAIGPGMFDTGVCSLTATDRFLHKDKHLIRTCCFANHSCCVLVNWRSLSKTKTYADSGGFAGDGLMVCALLDPCIALVKK